jgi:hypothetical protein
MPMSQRLIMKTIDEDLIIPCEARIDQWIMKPEHRIGAIIYT